MRVYEPESPKVEKALQCLYVLKAAVMANYEKRLLLEQIEEIQRVLVGVKS